MVVDFDRLRPLENSPLNLAHLELIDESRGIDDFVVEESKIAVRYISPVDISESMPNDSLTVFHLNCRGLQSSVTYLNELCMFSGIQILALTETWLQNHNSSLLEIGNYRLCLKNRETRQHGGLGAYIRKDLLAIERDDLRVNREMVFESLVLEVSKKSKVFYLVVVYRPPSSNINEFFMLLEKQLDMIRSRNLPIFVCGDFNIDLMNLFINTEVSQFLNIMLSYGLKPTITVPTRVTMNSASLIDNIFANVSYYNASVIINEVSDHFGIFLSVQNFFSKGTRLNSNSQNRYKKVIIDNNVLILYKVMLEKCNFEFLNSNELDINAKFQNWYSIINSLLIDCSICKNATRRRETPKKPWITQALLKAIIRRRYLFKMCAASNSVSDKTEYKIYSNQLNALLRKAKADYYRNQFKSYENKPRKTWQIIKSVVSSNYDGIFQGGIHNDNTIADIMCRHFANVGKDLVQSIVISEHEGSFKKYLSNASDVSAYLKPINASELSETLKI